MSLAPMEQRQILTNCKQLQISCQNVQEVRAFLGMVNQLSKFSEHLADKTKGIKELLYKGNHLDMGN